MKIGIIAVDFLPKIGGMENYALHLALNFKNEGHEVHLFVRSEASDVDCMVMHKDLTGNLNIDLPNLSKHKMDAWLGINSSYAMLANHVDNVFICAHGNDFLSPWVRYYLPQLQKRFIWRLRQPLEQWITRRKRDKCMHKVKGIFANSEFTYKKFLSLYPKLQDRLKVITPGVDPFYFDQNKNHSTNGTYNLISVSRLTNKRKNIENVILALAELKGEYSFNYNVIGDGSYKDDLESLIQVKKMDDCVHLLGRVSQDDLGINYAKANLFILTPWTSSTDVEGFGMVYLEANACGVPVLASKGNGSATAINEGVSGYFVESPDVEQCKVAIKKFFDQEIKFNEDELIAHAEPFRWPNIAKQFLNEITSEVGKN